MTKPDAIQAKHHQLIPVEELERAIADDRTIGFNDLSAHIAKNAHPYLAPSLTNSLKYITRFGRKDDERQEVEKSIWYLMDLHNRISDLKGEKRDFAPWKHLGKLSQLLAYVVKPFNKVEEETEVRETVLENWVIFEPEEAFTSNDSFSKRLNPLVIKDGDTIKFFGLEETSALGNNKPYKVEIEPIDLQLAIKTNKGFWCTNGFMTATHVEVLR